jgi:hypothetical protein
MSETVDAAMLPQLDLRGYVILKCHEMAKDTTRVTEQH